MTTGIPHCIIPDASSPGGPGGTASRDGNPRLLAGRGWLAGEPGGLFTLPDHAGKTAEPGR
jgi:hypothetical protein